jgi:hypothetical protein
MIDAIGICLGEKTAVVAVADGPRARILGSFERPGPTGNTDGYDPTFALAKKLAEEALGTKITCAVVAVPQRMEEALRHIFHKFALDAFAEVTFVDNAIAVEMAFPSHASSPESPFVFVCHRGDGTFELTLLTRDGAGFRTIEAEVHPRLTPDIVLEFLERSALRPHDVERVLVSGCDPEETFAFRVFEKLFPPAHVASNPECASALGAALQAAALRTYDREEVKTAPPPAPEPPEPFDLQQLLGVGTSFQTFKASVRDPFLRLKWGRGIVALKIPQTRKKERQVRADVETRWPSYRTIRSPHLLTPIDFVLFRKALVMVTPFVASGSLRQRLGDHWRATPLSVAELLPIARDVLKGLEVIHAAGTAHRSVHCSNILFDKNSAILDVLDLHPAGESEFDHMEAPSLYFAPEVVNGGPHTPATDVWSFGVTMYEALVGRTPFQGRNLSETYCRIVLREYEPISGDPFVGEMIDRTLALDPAARPSVTTLLASLA